MWRRPGDGVLTGALFATGHAGTPDHAGRRGAEVAALVVHLTNTAKALHDVHLTSAEHQRTVQIAGGVRQALVAHTVLRLAGGHKVTGRRPSRWRLAARRPCQRGRWGHQFRRDCARPLTQRTQGRAATGTGGGAVSNAVAGCLRAAECGRLGT